MTPDLQRIVEALKACRERYEIRTDFDAYDWWVFDKQEGYRIVTGSLERCQEAFDARCAEAMVRAIREPSQATVEAGWLKNICTSDQVWRAMCDAILGETQPGGARQGSETAESPVTSTAQGGALFGSPAPADPTTANSPVVAKLTSETQP